MPRVLRVLLLDMPAMLTEMLKHALLRQPGFQLVEEAVIDAETGNQPLVPDVVICGGTVRGVSRGTQALLGRWPKARIFRASDGGRRWVLDELRLHTTELGELSPHELALILRQGGQSTDGDHLSS